MRRLISILVACACLCVQGASFTSTALAEGTGGTDPERQFTIGWDPMDLPGMQTDYALDLYGAINSAERAAELTPYIAGLTAHGISYMAYYGFDHVEGDAYEHFPDLNTDADSDGVIDGVWVSLEGNYSEDYGMPDYYQHTIGSAAFRDYLIGSAALTIDAGGSAACYDVAVFTTNSFDPGSTAGFALYLVSEAYTTAELELAEGTELASFDYGAYLRDQGYTDGGITAATSGWWTNPDNPDWAVSGLDDPTVTPLWRAWITWHDVFLREFAQELSTTTKNYASTQYGRDFEIALNRYGNGMRWLASDIVDFECGETFIDDGSYSYPHQSMAPTYKANLTADQTRFWSWNWPVTRDGEGVLTDIAALYSAETLASGGILQFTLSSGEDDLLAALTPYSEMFRAYPELTGLTPEADAAIFYGLESNLGNECSFKGTACLLADSHVSYNVIFGGDGTVREDTVTAAELFAYSVVILPDVWELTENQISALLSYLNDGGTVIVTDGTDTGENADWTNLLNGGGGTWGAGEMIKVAGDPGNDYWSTTDQATRTTLLGDWQTATAGAMTPITTTFPADVNIYAYTDTADSSDVYHMVNSVYNESTGQVTSQTGNTITLQRPEGWTGDVTVSLVRPGDAVSAVLGTFAESETIQVTIDTLDIWGVLKVGSAISAPLAIDDIPFSEAKDVFDYEYWSVTGENYIAVNYEASDDTDLADVTLYYSYRARKEDAWGSWTIGVTEILDGDPVTHAEGTLLFDPTIEGEGYYRFYTLAQDDAAQTEPDKGFTETERGFDITPPPDILYTETHGVLSGEATQITEPSFTWEPQEDALSGLPVMEGEDCWQVMWGVTGNPQYYSSSTPAFTPDPIYPNGSVTEYSLWVRMQDNAGNWNGGEEGKFVYSLELPGAPMVLSYDADTVLKTRATLHAYLGTPGDASEVEVSFIWGTESGNYLYETIPQTMTASDDITAVIDGLSPDTTYYCRAKAAGTGTYTTYSGEISFTTAATGYELTVESQTGGSVTVPGEGTFLYQPNDVVDLTAVPGTGWDFECWTGGTGAIDDVNAAITTILIDADYSITATFAEIVTNTPPAKPVNVLPADGTTNEVDGFTLEASAFADDDMDSHAASQWRILDGQSATAWDSGETAVQLTACAVPTGTLDEGTTYSWQVRYKDDRGAWSEWSDATTFTTYTSVQAGDADGNGIVNVGDITSVARMILGMDTATDGADANDDGSVNVLDITMIVRIILQLD